MRKAHLLTIGTEIACGEIVNTNAAWLACRLEERGLRVLSHAVVRDQRDEILNALTFGRQHDVLIVTGGLGPTSDDMTRELVAEHFGRKLNFDQEVWEQFQETYKRRGLPLREAHKHQCYFPERSERLPNPVGTALGFAFEQDGVQVFVLPGPPAEMKGMWPEVESRLRFEPGNHEWIRWTCLGAPESEVAELVEPLIQEHDIEVGYRASVPYVHLKVYLDPQDPHHQQIRSQLENALAKFIVSRDGDDLAAELLRRWPTVNLKLHDQVTGPHLTGRLFEYKTEEKTIEVRIGSASDSAADLAVVPEGEGFQVRLSLPHTRVSETVTLPYRIQLDSDRGRRAAAEWAIWIAVKALREQAASPM